MSAIAVHEGQVLRRPSPDLVRSANITRFRRWVERERKRRFRTYNDLWQWSVDELEDFWACIWTYFGVIASRPYQEVLQGRVMPGAQWFDGAELNFAQHAFRNASPDRPALVFKREGEPLVTISWSELMRQVGSVAKGLRDMGVKRGDRVAGFLPNSPEAAVAFLATVSIGAIWSCCSPDFGANSVIDRFRQIEPKVLLAVDGYRYGGRVFDRRDTVQTLVRELPSLEAVIQIPYLGLGDGDSSYRPWSELTRDNATLEFEQVPFDHPLWIVYTSGTTGAPKAIVHGHGGILLEHFVTVALHMDLKPQDRFFWYSTTGWVMWNVLLSGLIQGATAVLYDGSPGYPSADGLWQLAEEAAVTWFGCGAAYLSACAKAGLTPGRTHDLSRLRAICYTGSPLGANEYGWVYEQVSPDAWFSSVSGGTDVFAAFVAGSPTLPVRAGEFQCRGLGVKVEAWDEGGRSVTNEVGELVVTEPLPSMPLRLWNDPGGQRYLESYFGIYPGVWRHGDWIKITKTGGAVIYGRSDATLKRVGVRLGSTEIYQTVEALPEISDSLVVDLTFLGREGWMPLFVVLREGARLDDAMKGRIRDELRSALSPRHVPDEIFAVPAIPRTLNNKKMEVPVRRILMGIAPREAVNLDSMSNPDALDYFIMLASSLNPGSAAT